MLAAYITFDGNTEEVFNFYKNGLGGTITNLQRFGDAPHGAEMPGADKNKIMHIALEAPGGIHLMGNDHIGEPFRPGNNFFHYRFIPIAKKRPINIFKIFLQVAR